MTSKTNDVCAFPSQSLGKSGILGDELTQGITLRDYFAGQVISGIFASSKTSILYKSAAEEAYIQADIMLKERMVGDGS